MCRSRSWLVAASIVVAIQSNAQNCGNPDCDEDGIYDALEQAIAERFAPEWRFNRYLSGDGSAQNNNEKNYPISVEKWFEQQESTGDQPYIACYYSVPQPPDPITQAPTPPQAYYHTIPIPDINQLSQLHNDLTDEPVSSENMTVEEYDVPFTMHIQGFPKDLLGDPDGFPTYYHCYERGGDVYIAYMLFYAYDEKATPGDIGDHRVDWSGINIKLSGIGAGDLDDVQAVSNASIEHVWYGGHTKSYIYPWNPNYYANGDHPRVYVSRGSHTCWPRPGEWHDFDVTPMWSDIVLSLFGPFGFGLTEAINSADDIFRGDGLIVQSWSEARELINLGESVHDDDDDVEGLEGIPLTGWGDFHGAMGPDVAFIGSADSPEPPWSKGEWLGGGVGTYVMEWSELTATYGGYMETFQPVNTPVGSGWQTTTDVPQVILWRGEKFNGEPWVITGPGEFDDITDLVYTENQFGLTYTGFSVLFAGKLRVKLYPELNFQGSPVTVTSSKHKVYGVYRSMRIESVEGWTCNMVVDDDATEPGDGSPLAPFNTIQEALDAVPPNGTICINGGNYSGNLNFNGPVKIRGQNGVVHIGE